MRSLYIILAARVLASFVVGIAATAMLGFTINESILTDWTGKTPMAIPTALAFVCSGVAILLLSIKQRI